MELQRYIRGIRKEKLHENVTLLVLKYGSEFWGFRTKDLRILSYNRRDETRAIEGYIKVRNITN
jgi:hypothetical protein